MCWYRSNVTTLVLVHNVTKEDIQVPDLSPQRKEQRMHHILCLACQLTNDAVKFWTRRAPCWLGVKEESGPRWRSVQLLVIFCGTLSLLLSCANRVIPQSQDPQVQKYQAHFKELNLPYMEPLGCSQSRSCQLVADFNDDGTEDLARLIEYSGPTERIGANYVDLVILYSTKDSAQPTHQIFRYVGAIDKENQVLAKLERQEAGEMQLPLGTITLKRPAINVRRDNQEPGTYFPTYYWSGTRFVSIDKSDD